MTERSTPSSSTADGRRVALVTGASRGIGEAVALRLARDGLDLCLTARDAAALERIADACRAAGARVHVVPGALEDPDHVSALVARAASALGRLDALINDAAWREVVTMRTITRGSWERTLAVCLTAPAFLSRDAAEVMATGGGGVIVNVSSIQATLVTGIAPAYVAAKAGLDTLTADLASLYGHRGVRVVSVRPGATDTAMGADYQEPGGDDVTADIRAYSEEMIPLRRWARPDEIAGVVAWLLGPDASYVTGTTITVDGGWSPQLWPIPFKQRLAPGDF